MNPTLPLDMIFFEVYVHASRATRTMLSLTCRAGHSASLQESSPKKSDPAHIQYKWLADKFERETRGDSEAASRFWEEVCSDPRMRSGNYFESVFAAAAKTRECKSLIHEMVIAGIVSPENWPTNRIYLLAYKHGNSAILNWAMKSGGEQFHYPAVAVSRRHHHMVEKWLLVRDFLGTIQSRNLRSENRAIIRYARARSWAIEHNPQYLKDHLHHILADDCLDVFLELQNSRWDLSVAVPKALSLAEIPQIFSWMLSNYSAEELSLIAQRVIVLLTTATPAKCVRLIMPICGADIIPKILRRPDLGDFLEDLFGRFSIKDILLGMHPKNDGVFLVLLKYMHANPVYSEDVLLGIFREIRTYNRVALYLWSDQWLAEFIRIYFDEELPRFSRLMRGTIIRGIRCIGNAYRPTAQMIERCYAEDDAKLLGYLLGDSKRYAHGATMKKLGYPAIPRIMAWRELRGFK